MARPVPPLVAERLAARGPPRARARPAPNDPRPGLARSGGQRPPEAPRGPPAGGDRLLAGRVDGALRAPRLAGPRRDARPHGALEPLPHGARRALRRR